MDCYRCKTLLGSEIFEIEITKNTEWYDDATICGSCYKVIADKLLEFAR